MYDDVIKTNTIDSLENKVVSIVNTSVALSSQGYLVNKNKYIKLDWSSIMIHAFENIYVLDEEQQRRVELLYNKISIL